jgi:hypothetical protein
MATPSTADKANSAGNVNGPVCHLGTAHHQIGQFHRQVGRPAGGVERDRYTADDLRAPVPSQAHRKDRTTTGGHHGYALAIGISDPENVRSEQREVSDDTARVVRSDIQCHVARA